MRGSERPIHSNLAPTPAEDLHTMASARGNEHNILQIEKSSRRICDMCKEAHTEQSIFVSCI
jgi:hypothetical protein